MPQAMGMQMIMQLVQQLVQKLMESMQQAQQENQSSQDTQQMMQQQMQQEGITDPQQQASVFRDLGQQFMSQGNLGLATLAFAMAEATANGGLVQNEQSGTI
jgi:hypothetical protein